MDLYDVMAPGFHSPLNAKEISQLFRAGHLDWQAPCKRLREGRWRTIDELFPLLKYEPSASLFQLEESRRSHDPILLAVVGTILAVILGGAAYYFWSPVGEVPTPAQTFANIGVQPILPVVARFTPAPYVPPARSIAPSRAKASPTLERLQAEKRQREQTVREQTAIADQMRANAESERQQQEKAAGTDQRVPLDENTSIPMPGGGVWVKIHDNDVTSFDVWINGSWRHEVRKQKGITHSGTDETLIYSNGRASLYYVWEISGRLNHCLLRVREQ